MRRRLSLSENEIVSYLKRTSLPTLLVEGSDDATVYRWLESRISLIDVDILVCNGRTNLLKIFKRKSEFQDSQVVFVADQDMWYFTGVPSEFIKDIVFTSGFSIENDLYVRDLFEGLLDADEKKKFKQTISSLAKWFAFEVEKYSKSGSTDCDFHINQICPANILCPIFKKRIGFIAPPPKLVEKVIEEYSIALRGKNLFQALLRFLSDTKRVSKFSRMNLIELGAKTGNDKITALIVSIEDKLNSYNKSRHTVSPTL